MDLWYECQIVPPTDPRDDGQLVTDLNAGDLSAFDVLYWRYRDRVMRLAMRFTGNHADALDVLQETFAYLHRKFPGFELRASLTTFLYPAVRNLALEARRKRIRSLGAGQDPAGMPLPAQLPKNMDAMRAEMADAIASLPEIHQQVVLLRFADDFTIDEIAAALDVPAGTIKSRLHHAINTLRDDPRMWRYFS